MILSVYSVPTVYYTRYYECGSLYYLLVHADLPRTHTHTPMLSLSEKVLKEKVIHLNTQKIRNEYMVYITYIL